MQLEQLELPLDEYLPESQLVHVVDPETSENMPSLHIVHVEEAEFAWYCPGLQLVQVALVVKLYLPATHA